MAEATNKNRSSRQLRVAIVHDWLTNVAGAERVVFALLEAYPDADVYTSVYNDKAVPQLKGRVQTSFLQKWPFAARKHQLYPVLRTYAFESFDLSMYDLVISSSSAEAKGVITPSETLHVSYIHTPVRYYWSNYDQYLKDPGFGLLNPLVRLITPGFVKWMKHWDYAAAQRPDALLANSLTVQKRIKKYYERDAVVIHPPVDLDRFDVEKATIGDYYLVVSRLVAYKRYDLAVEACTKLGKKLIVVGNGPEMKWLVKLAGPTVQFAGALSDEEIAELYLGCRAFIFPGEEDFGITPLEAMACGKPVIGFNRGGVSETVIEGKTGLFFSAQTVAALSSAIERFESMNFNPALINRHAQTFGTARFITQIKDVIAAELE